VRFQELLRSGIITVLVSLRRSAILTVSLLECGRASVGLCKERDGGENERTERHETNYETPSMNLSGADSRGTSGK
jgi:hypothetical protein